MMNFFKSRLQVLCAFCRSPRRIHRKRHISAVDFAGAALGASALTYAVYGGFDGMGILLFGVFAVAAEIFVQMRWRVSIPCPHCGFDPVLYARKPADAAEKVKIRLAARKNDPRALLGRPLQIPMRRISEAEKRHKGQNLSREL